MAEDGRSPPRPVDHVSGPAPLEQAAASPSLAQPGTLAAVQQAAEAAPQQPTQQPGASSAPPTQPPAPTVEQCWQTAFDHNSQRW